MIMQTSRLSLFVLLLTTALALPAKAGSNMIGNQSQNEGIPVVPAPGAVEIDGDLADWDLSGRIWIFADKSVRGRFSAQVSAMWSSEALYLAVRWKDPTPMYSTVNPEFNPEDGWKSDSIQFRVWTPDQVSWVTTWYYTPNKQPVLHHAVWKEHEDLSAGTVNRVFTKADGSTKLGEGLELAYQKVEGEQGYVQEMRIPWDKVYKTAPQAAPGQTLRIGMEVLWGDPSGGVNFPIHRYADSIQPGVTKREFFWSAFNSWGDATLLAEGNIEPRRYVSDEGKLRGTIPIRAELPSDAQTFSLAIDDATGQRVRNIGGLDVADYVVEERDGRATVEVMWDGARDEYRPAYRKRAKDAAFTMVAPGQYRVSGVYHQGIGAKYDMSFYNPGTPPWGTADGTGAWGADHSAPRAAVRAGDMMILSWSFAEGGHGIIALSPEGRKVWGEKRGGRFLAADSEYVYAIPAGWHIKEEVLIRLRKKDGAYAPFRRDGKELPFELATEQIFGGKVPGEVVDMAAGEGALALAMSDGEIVLLDKASAAIVARHRLPGTVELTFADANTVYALTDGAGAALQKIDLQSGKATVIPTPGLEKAKALAVDRDGNAVIFDGGADSQLKIYSPKGKLLATRGKKGGRPIRGAFDPEAMMRVSSVAIDPDNNAWVTEYWNYPRRVSVWSPDGKLKRDYVGNTSYGGSAAYLHDSDPTLAYIGPVELKLDHENKTWKVTQVLWVPDKEQGEMFPISVSSHSNPQRFISDASGQPREYLYDQPTYQFHAHLLYMEREDGWKPVAAVAPVGVISGKIGSKGVVEMPSGEWSDLDPYDVAFWTDRNADGIPQRSEAAIMKTDNPGKKVGGEGQTAFRMTNGWGGRIDPTTMTFYTTGLRAVRPTGFTDDGIPIWTPESVEMLKVKTGGDIVPDPTDSKLLVLSNYSYDGLLAVDLKSGEKLWSYPNLYPLVHGSHRAPMPQPGLLIGPLKILGIARANDEVGNVLLLRGNLGQDFMFTTDGHYVGTLFRDVRLPGEPLPDDEQSLYGRPMEAYSGGGEPFNGWFGTQADGVTRMLNGLPRQAAMVHEITGLESIARIGEQTLDVSPEQIAAARSDIESRQSDGAAKTFTISRVDQPPAVDGNSGEWTDVRRIEAKKDGLQESAIIKLAYDDVNLYALFEVRDATPWRNQSRDSARLFKTGDTVDLQLGRGGNTSASPQAGDTRVLIAPGKGGPTVVLMRPVDDAADSTMRRSYSSPVHAFTFDRVQELTSVKAAVKTRDGGYTVEVAIPWSDLGIKPEGGATLAGDFGFTASDAAGQSTVSRTYWSNGLTNLVNDEPAEAWLYPQRWGKLMLQKK